MLPVSDDCLEEGLSTLCAQSPTVAFRDTLGNGLQVVRKPSFASFEAKACVPIFPSHSGGPSLRFRPHRPEHPGTLGTAKRRLLASWEPWVPWIPGGIQAS